MNAFTKEDLKYFQSESLPQKEQRSFAKIGEWYSYWNNNVFVSFSGGKDSTVLADLCAYWCSVINATLYLMFVNTGLEYPEIQKHVKFFAEWLREKSPSRFELLKETHPKQYNYCLNGGEYNENGVWQPSKKGLGMRHVFEELKKIYGDGFIKY